MKRYHCENKTLIQRNRRMNFSHTKSAAMLAAWFVRHTAPNGVRRVAQLHGAVATDLGSVREENQDRVALVRGRNSAGEPFILAALADGIGGMKQGAECAAVALGTFIDSVVTDAQHSTAPIDWLTQGALRANRAVYAKFAGEGGSTLVAALLVSGSPPYWLSIGDSRAYQASSGKLHQLSLDDTIEGQLGKVGGGRRRDLLQFVGIGDALEPHIEAIASVTGTVLLTSDGVHFIDADYLAKVVYHAPDLGFCVRRLTELAKMLGGPDNATVAALSLDAVTPNAERLIEDAYEIWDPFGELLVILDGGPRKSISDANPPAAPAGKPKNPTASAPTPFASPRDSAAPSLTPEMAPVDDLSSTKGKLPQRKSKGARKKPKEDSHEAKQLGAPDEPQLFIEFPSKKP